MRAPRSRASAASRSLQQWPLLVVVAGVAIGLGIAALGDDSWRIGCVVIGSSVCFGAVERIVLPRRDAGLLQVRSQPFDVAVLSLVGIAIIVLAVWVHGN